MDNYYGAELSFHIPNYLGEGSNEHARIYPIVPMSSTKSAINRILYWLIMLLLAETFLIKTYAFNYLLLNFQPLSVISKVRHCITYEFFGLNVILKIRDTNFDYFWTALWTSPYSLPRLIKTNHTTEHKSQELRYFLKNIAIQSILKSKHSAEKDQTYLISLDEVK